MPFQSKDEVREVVLASMGFPVPPRTTHIEDLEHDGNEYVPAMFPYGQYPNHCDLCAYLHDLKENT